MVVLLIMIFVIAECIINPIGEFPLNDDWSYTRSLQHLYETHQLRLEGFTSMPLIGQLLWALLFCKIFGFSFTVLRLSTLVLSLAGVIAGYFLIRELSGKEKVAFAGALILMFNPIYLNLSNTFMTDVPFMTMLLFALYFFVRALKQERAVFIAAGVFFVLAATMIRQLGLLAALSFSFCYLYSGGFKKARWLPAIMALGIPAGVYLLFNEWLKRNTGVPVMYHEGTKQILFNLFYADYSTPVFLVKQVFNIFMYTGFFIFPWIFLFDRRKMSPGAGKLLYYCGFFLLIAGGYFLVFRRLMPYTGNIMSGYGLGIVALRDVMILKTANLALLPQAVFIGVTLAGATGAGLLLFVLVRYWKKAESVQPAGKKAVGILRRLAPSLKGMPVEVLLLLLFLLLYLFVMVVGGSFDRYLVAVIPVCSALIIYKMGDRFSSSGRHFGLVMGVLVVYGIFSISLTGEYLSWNRARWDAIRSLTVGEGVAPEKIDGGFEFNGYYLYDGSVMKLEEDPAKKSWWWVQDDAYQLAFGPLEGYTVLKTFPCQSSLFPFSSEDIFVLKRN